MEFKTREEFRAALLLGALSVHARIPLKYKCIEYFLGTGEYDMLLAKVMAIGNTTPTELCMIVLNRLNELHPPQGADNV